MSDSTNENNTVHSTHQTQHNFTSQCPTPDSHPSNEVSTHSCNSGYLLTTSLCPGVFTSRDITRCLQSLYPIVLCRVKCSFSRQLRLIINPSSSEFIFMPTDKSKNKVILSDGLNDLLRKKPSNQPTNCNIKTKEVRVPYVENM